MNVAIRYYSRTGNTGKLAQGIAQAAGVPAETVETPLEGEVDVLFLGSAVYAAGVDEKVKAFIQGLDPAKVKKVVNFSTAALLPSTYGQIGKLLAEKDIPLDSREFHCRGKFSFMHKGRPNAEDIAAVQQFTKQILSGEA